MTGNIIGAVLAVIVFIGTAVWCKAWIAVIFPGILFVPEFLVGFMNVQESVKTITSSLIVMSLSLIYLLVLINIDKSTNG